MPHSAKNSPKPLIFRPFLSQNRPKSPKKSHNNHEKSTLPSSPSALFSSPSKSRHPSGAEKKKKKNITNLQAPHSVKNTPKPLIFRPFLGQNRSKLTKKHIINTQNTLYPRLPAPF
jgi:hypothetical protein